MSSSESYDSEGKRYARKVWQSVISTAYKKYGPLEVCWLARNDLADLLPMMKYIRGAYVPESNLQSLNEKWWSLNKHPRMWSKICLPHKPLEISYELTHQSKDDSHPSLLSGSPYDVFNLDFCTHFSPRVLKCVNIILENKLICNAGVIFLTVSHSSRSQKSHKSEDRSLAKNLSEVVSIIEGVIRSSGYTPLPVDPTGSTETLELPFRYENSSGRIMYSMGWRVSPLRG